MKIFYNPDNEGFYHEGVQKNIPEQSIEITPKQYTDFRSAQSAGKKVVFTDNAFQYQDRIPSPQELNIVELSWLDVELIRAGNELDKVQDSDPKSVGSVFDWRNYRKALRAWPEHKDFPDKNFRPKAPDSKE